MTWRYGFAAVVFTLLAWSGADLLVRGATGLAVPFLIAGGSGALASVTWLTNRRPRFARPAMLVAAVAVAVTGVIFAPGGMDRGFVIRVALFLAGLLAAFTLLATPRATPGSSR